MKWNSSTKKHLAQEKSPTTLWFHRNQSLSYLRSYPKIHTEELANIMEQEDRPETFLVFFNSL